MTIKQILIKYWGFSSFRPMQEDIIHSVLTGEDTLALLPTGGGKSICFQVPALAKEGLCIVISPLIALMKDQVENLKKRGIKATAIYSGMSKSEIDIAIDNCIYGDYKFLYMSPERLETKIIKARMPKMNVNLLAVDESHCISQWGYDFRPPYLRIADIRELIPDAPVLALTATATPNVVKDIQERLRFKEENVFQKSFERKNLVYAVVKEEDKLNRLLRVMRKVSGTGIVYLRNRRKTKEIAEFLKKNGVKADFYHAGLDPAARDKKQNEWVTDKTRVIAATNAFGMGIDKPGVRFVVHLDIPDCLEAYFQEAGRGGRDGNKAYAVMLYNDSDIIDAKKFHEQSFPELDTIKNIYNALGNYFQLATGSGKDVSFDFEIRDFSQKYGLKPITVFNSLKFLEKEGYLVTTAALRNPSKVHFTMDREELYKFQVRYKYFDNFIKMLLRSYGGIFSDYVKIDEQLIANRMGTGKKVIEHHLQRLAKFGVLHYLPRKEKPQIIFTRERLDKKEIRITPEHYRDRKKAAEERLQAVINYVENDNKCRSQQLLAYFGETESRRCGHCDVCLQRNKLELSRFEFDQVLNQIKPSLQKQPLKLEEVVTLVKKIPENKTLKVIQWLLDNEKVFYDKEQKLRWGR